VLDNKTRVIRALLMSACMVFMVTLVTTVVNLGWHSGFVRMWIRAYAIAWPIGAAAAWLVMPGVNRVADRIVARSERAGKD
jgi:uncharacterized membrane protein YccC